ncbi:MAG: hypothetical protein HKN13_02700 [Rhodothermales bacterium]|nr:hypothetical protein [Rhodothermales bacterium]
MKLPNAERAIIDISKLRDYCLDSRHPRGKHKARVFKSALGFTQTDADALKQAIETGILNAECEVAEEDPYGRRFVVDFEIRRGDRSAQIRALWIIKHGEEAPRLTSCYVRE